MKTLIAALALGALVATPAFAHVHGSQVSTGKATSSKANYAHGHRAFAHVAPPANRSTSPQAAYGAVTSFGSPTARDAQIAARGTREAALRECSTESRQYTETTWGDMQMQKYRACMMQHGQPE